MVKEKFQNPGTYRNFIRLQNHTALRASHLTRQFDLLNMRTLRLAITFVLLLMSTTLCTANAHPNTTSKDITYTVRYQRWGDFGSYHLGMKVNMLTQGKPTATWYINGSWDTTFAHDTLFVYQIPLLFPVFLKAYVHPARPTSPLFNIRNWEEFGPTTPIDSETALKLITMSHYGMTKINSGEFMYSPIVKPFKIGGTGFWTSNSYVASLIHWANESGQNLALPIGGSYPGIDGPFIPKSVFEEEAE